MTGRELIMWILEHKCEDAKIEVQYRDGGGDYNGTDETLYLLVEDGRDKDGWCYKRLTL